MTRGRLLLTVLFAIIIIVGLSYAWGASGRAGVQRVLDATQQQLDLAEARGAVLDARVSLYNNNFGDASRRLEDAKTPLRRARARYQDAGRRDAATGVDAALGYIDEAQRLAGKLDSTANARAADALEALKVAGER
jgi:hypothetical protein